MSTYLFHYISLGATTTVNWTIIKTLQKVKSKNGYRQNNIPLNQILREKRFSSHVQKNINFQSDN